MADPASTTAFRSRGWARELLDQTCVANRIGEERAVFDWWRADVLSEAGVWIGIVRGQKNAPQTLCQ